MIPKDWKEASTKVNSLSLDPKNPRIPDSGVEPSTRDLIAALVEYEDVYELAKQLIDFGGLFPTDSLVAVEEGGRKIVVEGNRRLAALMLLASPELAPDNFVKRFRGLSEQISDDAIARVDVVFAPSRAAAAPIILARHTGDSLKRWKPGQQAKYIRTLHTPGEPISELAHRIKMSEAEIRKELKTDTMLHVARSLELAQDVKSAIDDARSFPYSVLERLVESPQFLKFLGVAYDNDANIVGSIDPDEFRKGLGRVVSDIAKNKVDTRKLNKAKDVDSYLNSLGNDAPNKRKRGTFTSSSLIEGNGASAPAALPTQPKKGKGKPSISLCLPPRDFKMTASNVRVQAVFKELRRLHLDDFPNSCGVMFRVFFEQLLTHYLDETKKMALVVADARKRDPNNKRKQQADYHPSMTEMMKYIMADQSIITQIPAQAQKLINRMIDSKTEWFSLELMNFYVHNVYAKPKESDIRSMWTILQPLMKQMMV